MELTERIMKKLADIIIRGRVVILAVFLVLAVISAILSAKVKINFDLFSYLPKDAPSTIAVNKMTDEFDQDIPNFEIGIPCGSVSEALQMKKRIAALDHVRSVLWLDDQCDIAIPVELLNKKLVEGFYKDGMALYQVTVSKDVVELDFLNSIYALAGEEAAVRGELVEHAYMQSAITTEITRIMAFAIPMALIILLLTTTSWFEPFLFLIVIFCGVLLNMGTNVFFKDISFITQAVGSILQLAVSMDYGIFLLHRFNEFRGEGLFIKEAMRRAIVKSIAPISASAVTTVFGFLALIFMRYGIGADLGIVLAKGVLFSLISVFLLLPSLATLTYRLIDKTTHRSFLPSFERTSRFIIRIGVVIMIGAVVIIVPSFIAQSSNHFLYGSRTYPSGSRQERDAMILQKQFGNNMPMALLVPKGEWAKEGKLVDELLEMPEVKSAVGYVTAVGRAVPNEILPERKISALLSERYSRIVVIVDSPDETNETYAIAERIRDKVHEVYPGEDTHLTGANMVLLDMRSTFKKDVLIVDGLAIVAIAVVILLTFRSLVIPLLLVLTIELSIWVNLAIPYLFHIPLNFIGFLVISTVQLGATVDYGILMTQHYLDHRLLFSRKEAAVKTIRTAAGSLIPPALILSIAGFVLYFTSSISVVREIGHVLGRGALTSLFMVLFLLPNLLRLFDRVIEKTTWKLKLLPDKKSFGAGRVKSGVNVIHEQEAQI